MKRRSSFTNYTWVKASIFEYKERFIVLEECQQGQVLIPAHGSEQRVSDFADLSGTLRLDCTAKEMGQVVFKALENFDTKPHPYGQFDFSSRNRYIKKWMGARGIDEWETNQRVVDIEQELDSGKYIVRPFDNCNIHPWNGPEGMPEIELSASATIEEIGQAVLDAFKLATYNPSSKRSADIL